TALLDHVRCDFRFRADWSLTPGKAHAFTFREGNYDTDLKSLLLVRLVGSPYLTLEGQTVPGEAVHTDPEKRTHADRERLRRVGATVRAVASADPAGAMPALPPDCSAKPPAVGRWRARVGKARPTTTLPFARLRHGPPVAEDDWRPPGESEPT